MVAGKVMRHADRHRASVRRTVPRRGAVRVVVVRVGVDLAPGRRRLLRMGTATKSILVVCRLSQGRESWA